MSYPGPPPTSPPPPGWRPPVVAEPTPPRTLPPQDHTALTTAERQAQLVTWAVGAGAGVVALLLSCVLVGRLLG
ncbi:hypothetical protein JQS43_21355 [Natronosporangium hydrolyticum]|uniref:Uncharacterized protein n=1 Tax=Natronosporangium hydrolyticum TaxID=2811111 RepID=A0A895Y8K7_9ACTN|nr:hypothetical protein [Natronosporangium hydrolyticum]QSB14057.1 hypothetical protein JQS43_21355 [Natronosporangium hydrolyticum]